MAALVKDLMDFRDTPYILRNLPLSPNGPSSSAQSTSSMCRPSRHEGHPHQSATILDARTGCQAFEPLKLTSSVRGRDAGHDSTCFSHEQRSGAPGRLLRFDRFGAPRPNEKESGSAFMISGSKRSSLHWIHLIIPRLRWSTWAIFGHT
jgi:hypothetical protein